MNWRLEIPRDRLNVISDQLARRVYGELLSLGYQQFPEITAEDFAPSMKNLGTEIVASTLLKFDKLCD